jgi:hypothetical protein
MKLLNSRSSGVLFFMSKQDKIYFDHLQREIDLLTLKNKQLEEKVKLLEVENLNLKNNANRNHDRSIKN